MKQIYICEDTITGIYSALHDAWKECRDTQAGVELRGHQDCEKGLASFDGDSEIPMITGDKIVIRKAEVKTRILKLNHLSFVEVLRQKMRDS